MSITEVFDRAKKQLEGGSLRNGYKIGHEIYKTYYTNTDWDLFIKEMPKDIYSHFEKSQGGEIKEHTRRGHTYPPKMASYASSSRFMYEQGKNILGIIFEEKLKTGMQGYPANIDGYLESKNVYIEAKCHEFYEYSRPKAGEGLKNLLNSIKDHCPLTYELSSSGTLYLKWKGNDTGHFDLKQMLCHLSGIANRVLKDGNKKVNFIYLVYCPSVDLLKFVPKEADRQRIQKLYDKEKETANIIDFKSIYGAILRYFNCEKKKGYNDNELTEMTDAFSFHFCTQDNFKTTIEDIKSSIV